MVSFSLLSLIASHTIIIIRWKTKKRRKYLWLNRNRIIFFSFHFPLIGSFWTSPNINITWMDDSELRTQSLIIWNCCYFFHFFACFSIKYYKTAPNYTKIRNDLTIWAHKKTIDTRSQHYMRIANETEKKETSNEMEKIKGTIWWLRKSYLVSWLCLRVCFFINGHITYAMHSNQLLVI